MNYAALGSAIAYHLSHILLEGRNYDLYGNLREWSTTQSLLKFDEKLNCLAEQYRQFYVPELNGRVSFSQEIHVSSFLFFSVTYKEITFFNSYFALLYFLDI